MVPVREGAPRFGMFQALPRGSYRFLYSTSSGSAPSLP